MELGVAVRAHVGDVQIADPAAGLVARRARGSPPPSRDSAAASRSPSVVIAICRRARRARGAHGERDLLAGLVDQQLEGRVLRPTGLAADREQVVAFGDAHAGRAQRRARLGVPRVAVRNAANDPGARRGVPLDVGAEQTLMPGRAGQVVAAQLVAVRGAELALQLPDQVGELGARADALDQRQVPVERAGPVDAATCPRSRTGRAAAATPRAASAATRARAPPRDAAGRGRSSPTRGPARPCAPGRAASIPAGSARRRLPARTSSVWASSRQRDLGDVREQRLGVVALEVPDLDPGLGLRRSLGAPVLVERSLDRHRSEEHAAVAADDLEVAALRHREGDHAVGDALEVDASRSASRRRCPARPGATAWRAGDAARATRRRRGTACRRRAAPGRAPRPSGSRDRSTGCRGRDRSRAATGSRGTSLRDRTTARSRRTPAA